MSALLLSIRRHHAILSAGETASPGIHAARIAACGGDPVRYSKAGQLRAAGAVPSRIQAIGFRAGAAAPRATV